MGIQSRVDKEKFSRLRQSLVQLAVQIRSLIQSLISDKPLVRGSVYDLKRKCGKPGCKCAKGHLHSRMVLSASEGGRTRLRVIPRGSLTQVEIKVRRYQQFRRARARLGEMHKKMLLIIDEMETMRREEMDEEGTGKSSVPGSRRTKIARSRKSKQDGEGSEEDR
jgi:hypothetical protein